MSDKMEWYWMPGKETPKQVADAQKNPQKFYALAPWRKCRQAYLSKNPKCEASIHLGRIEVNDLVVDHIIPINLGGAPFDFRNLMTLNNRLHGRKSRMETGRSTSLIASIETPVGKIPKNRNDIFKKILPKPKKENHKVEIVF